jgi:hypothetical protein
VVVVSLLTVSGSLYLAHAEQSESSKNLASVNKSMAVLGCFLNPFTAEVAIMRLLGSAPKSHLCDQTRRSKVTGLSDLMTLFIDLG